MFGGSVDLGLIGDEKKREATVIDCKTELQLELQKEQLHSLFGIIPAEEIIYITKLLEGGNAVEVAFSVTLRPKTQALQEKQG